MSDTVRFEATFRAEEYDSCNEANEKLNPRPKENVKVPLLKMKSLFLVIKSQS